MTPGRRLAIIGIVAGVLLIAAALVAQVLARPAVGPVLPTATPPIYLWPTPPTATASPVVVIVTATGTPTSAATATLAPTDTATATITPTAALTSTATPQGGLVTVTPPPPTATAAVLLPTVTTRPTDTPQPTRTPRPTDTPTALPIATDVPTATPLPPTATPQPRNTAPPTNTPSATIAPTDTALPPSDTPTTPPTATATATPTSTATATTTSTPSSTTTATPSPSATPLPTNTATPLPLRTLPPTSGGATATPASSPAATTSATVAAQPGGAATAVATAVQSGTPGTPTNTATITQSRTPGTPTITSVSTSVTAPREVATATPEPPATAAWLQKTTAHFTLRYLPGSAAAADIEQLAGLVENSLQEAATALQVPTQTQITIYFVNRVFWQGGAAYEHNQLVLTYAEPSHSYTSTDFPTVLRHEISHALVGQLAGDSKRGGFLGEGTAVWAAGGHYRREPVEVLAAALLQSLSARYIPFSQLQEHWADAQHELAYIEAGSFVKYLVQTYGLPEYKQFLADQEHPRTVYGKDLNALEQEWTAWLGTVPVSADDVQALVLRVRYYNLMRRYETLADTDALILPGQPPAEWGQSLINIFSHPSETSLSVTIESAMVAAGAALWADELPACSALLDEIDHTLDAAVPATPTAGG